MVKMKCRAMMNLEYFCFSIILSLSILVYVKYPKN